MQQPQSGLKADCSDPRTRFVLDSFLTNQANLIDLIGVCFHLSYSAAFSSGPQCCAFGHKKRWNGGHVTDVEARGCL